LSIGHISPEAAAGGPIAVVQPGDRIAIDINAGQITLLVSGAELARRLRAVPPFQAKIRGGYLERYTYFVTSASQGAVLRVPAPTTNQNHTNGHSNGHTNGASENGLAKPTYAIL
jgi:dihydroxy-acid dehydratase